MKSQNKTRDIDIWLKVFVSGNVYIPHLDEVDLSQCLGNDSE